MSNQVTSKLHNEREEEEKREKKNRIIINTSILKFGWSLEYTSFHPLWEPKGMTMFKQRAQIFVQINLITSAR